jgi:UDP-N-acetyl-D-galactosamine dehydrogenase
MQSRVSKAKFNKTIAVIGLGYVGLPLAVEFGRKRPTIGFDVNQARIEELKAGLDRTREVTKDALREADSLCFTADEAELAGCEIFIVTVPTPVDESNRPDLGPLRRASQMLGRHLKKDDLVIYESTVFPGATEEVCVPELEDASGLRFNEDFFCGYSPERINPGDKVNTLTKITKITSGSTPEAAAQVDALYGEIIDAGTWRASTIKVAEAAKVIENSQRDLNIAFVNELSVIFDRLGIDTTEVLEAAGTKWNFLPFRPGMVGGHCIGVDPYYLTHRAEQAGYNPQIILAGRRMNDNMARYAARTMAKRMANRGCHLAKARVGVLGVTFKENCPDIRNSKVFDLITELEGWGIEVVAQDPWADPAEVRHEYGVTLAQDPKEGAFDALVVAVGHEEYRGLAPKMLRGLCNADSMPVLGDLKALFNREACLNVGFDVFRF